MGREIRYVTLVCCKIDSQELPEGGADVRRKASELKSACINHLLIKSEVKHDAQCVRRQNNDEQFWQKF